MDIRPDLPPELQEVETKLQALFKNGVLKTCKVLIGQLAAEAEFSQVVIDEAELTTLKLEEDVETFPEIQQSANGRLRQLE